MLLTSLCGLLLWILVSGVDVSVIQVHISIIIAFTKFMFHSLNLFGSVRHGQLTLNSSWRLSELLFQAWTVFHVKNLLNCILHCVCAYSQSLPWNWSTERRRETKTKHCVQKKRSVSLCVCTYVAPDKLPLMKNTLYYVNRHGNGCSQEFESLRDTWVFRN